MSSSIAVSILPREVRLLVARANGALKPQHQLGAKLPQDTVRAGLQAPNITDVDAVKSALSRLAREANVANERGGMVAVLVPDGAVRVALTPLEGGEPGRAEGEAMARWALQNLLNVDNGAARIDWSVVRENHGEPPAGWLLAIGADRTVVREYEEVIESVGWTPGRVVPLTMALAVGAPSDEQHDDARIVLSGIGGRVACLVEAAGVPRFHRAWRGIPADLVAELTAVQRYVYTRLGVSIGAAVLAGPDAWRKRMARECSGLGWRTRECSGWSAHLGAMQP